MSEPYAGLALISYIFFEVKFRPEKTVFKIFIV